MAQSNMQQALAEEYAALAEERLNEARRRCLATIPLVHYKRGLITLAELTHKLAEICDRIPSAH